jgi:hypothetical protein
MHSFFLRICLQAFTNSHVIYEPYFSGFNKHLPNFEFCGPFDLLFPALQITCVTFI